MAKQSRGSSNKKYTPQINSFGITPDEILDTVDTGDDMQRRLRYQHAYGVILLLAALSGKKPYTVLWSEHHEDLLGQRNDSLFDAYQVKTRQDGRWNLSHQPIKDSIKRFVEVDLRFPGKIKQFFFVSNAYYEDSKAQDKVGHSPKSFLQAVKRASSPSDLRSPFDIVFEELRTHGQCEPLSLMTVLKKLDFLTGPSLDSFEAVIAQDHLPAIPECHELSATALAQLRDELIAKVNKVSSLSVNDPVRHWYGLNQSDHDNPKLQAKSITTESILSFIRESQPRLLNPIKEASVLSERQKKALDFYLTQSFEDDWGAKLDQAGETEPARTTPLHQVFVDLELKPRSDQLRPPHHVGRGQLDPFADMPEIAPVSGEKSLSAMNCFLKEVSPKIVIIGGPGQGKSTLGQYLAQVHRAIILEREADLYRNIAGSPESQRKFQPKKVRRPFRIILKYFAQWLADGQALDTIEAYIAEQINKGASQPGEINATTVQEILKAYHTLLILDGLDEVTEPDLCNRMLECIEGFLGRVELLEADMQVIATSRPTSYRDQFTPRLFWHLELQPMSVEKAKEYAACWIQLKEPIDEERRRIRGTMEECLKESHTSQLLTTPLQVSIILLIIKNGGRPPSQREELFQQYWTTILRREKSKGGGMIRTEDSVLFNLHAYLGYLLHRNAISKNVRSLFPAKEFEQIVCDFLRLKDTISSSESIRQRAALIVEEARKRLVLIVEPVADFFGFELRSLQEFFAGAYLVQTAHDTQQRFDRLRAIAYSEHWRNVALFSAGRIVRDYNGEAFKILEEVCRFMERYHPDTYLHRGAWLALDIAADGIFTTNDRNLQFSTLELALTVLQTGMTVQEQGHFIAAIEHLPSQDRRDILSRLFKQKLNSLPLSCLVTALSQFGHFIETKDFIPTLEILLLSNNQEYIQQAIIIGFQHKVNPEWLALQLERYWHVFMSMEKYSFWWLWYQDRLHLQKVLSALHLSEARASILMDQLSEQHVYYRQQRKVDFKLMENPKTSTEQIVLLLQCMHIVQALPRPWKPIRVQLAKSVRVDQAANREHTMDVLTKVSAKSDLLATLDQLIRRSDLMPQLKVYLWILYWRTHEPTEPTVTTFLAEISIWSGNKVLSRLWQQELYNFWPLFTFAMESQMNNDRHTVALLKPYLNASEEFSFNQQVRAALLKGLSNLSHEEQLTTIVCNDYPIQTFPELASIAEKLGVDSNRLIKMYTSLEWHAGLDLSPSIGQRIFSSIEEGIVHSQQAPIIWWHVFPNWELDPGAIQQGAQLVRLAVARLSQQPNIFQITLFLFLKLLSFDSTLLPLASKILGYLADETYRTGAQIWGVVDVFTNLIKEHLMYLAGLTNHKDVEIQQGALTFWTEIIQIISSGGYPKQQLQMEVLSFDWKLGLSLIKDTNMDQRKKGILLLTYSHFPISETRYFTELRNVMAQGQAVEEISAWTAFLRDVVVSKAEKKAGQNLFETLLDAPQNYSPSILTAAKERYIELVGVAGPEIKDERILDLPMLAPSKKSRAKR